MSDAEDHGHFPLRTHLGFAIDQPGVGEAVAHLEVGPDHLNPNGAVHGAVLFALADTAMGAATMSVLDDGRFCASIELQLRFFSPVLTGRVEARTRVIRQGERVVHLESRLHVDDAPEPAALATGSFAVLGG